MTFIASLKERYGSLDQEAKKLVLILATAVVALIVIYISLSSYLMQQARVKASREQTLKELLVLRQRFQEVSADAQRLNNRMASVAPDDSPATIIEQTGLVPKGGIQSKPLPRQDRGTLIEEGAEVTLSGLSLNETINLLHRLEQNQKPVAIRKATLRTRFNEPAKLDITLQMALMKKAVQEKR